MFHFTRARKDCDMERKDVTTIREIKNAPESYTEKNLILKGWVRKLRASNTFGFIEFNDGTYFTNLQIVFEASVLQNYSEIAALNIGASITVTGKLILTPKAPQPYELHAKEILIEGPSTPDYPIQNKRHTMEYLRSIAHLRPRAATFYAVFRVRSVAAYAIHRFFQERGFVYVHTPIITCSDCEGAGEMFRVTTIDPDNPPRNKNGEVDYSKDFFGRQANLTVSGQLNVESFAMAYSNVYTFGPTFRAERSNTPRHAAEFWMIEPEIAFADLEDDMDLAEAMMKYIVSYVLENCPAEMEFFNKFIDKTLIGRLKSLVEGGDFGRISYTEAIEILKKADKKFEFPVSWGMDLQTEHERYLTEVAFGKPVFVTDYPRDIKAFYMRLNDDGKTVAAADMLVPGVGELIGGSQREERSEYLAAAIKHFGLSEKDYWWYMELRKYGSVKHAGFGLGFERLLMYITGIQNIRDVQPYPRTTGNAEF